MLIVHDWFEAQKDQAGELAQAFARNPVLATAALFFALAIGWWKWRLVSSGVQQGIEGQTAGWDRDATSATRKTVVSSEDILIMRLANRPVFTALFALFFFGGCAIFHALVPLQEDPSLKNWGVQVILVLGAVSAVLVLWSFSWRLIVSNTTIEKTAFLRRTQVFPLSSLQSVVPEKNLQHAVVLHFNDGRELRVRAVMTGYANLLSRLEKTDPKLALLSRMVQGARQQRGRNARTSRS